MDEITNLLGEEIKERITYVASLPVGEERTKAVEDLSKLHQLRVEEMKIETDREDKRQHLELEKESKEDERLHRKAQRRDNFINLAVNVGVQIGLAVAGWAVYDLWHKRGLRFEETGTITSPWTRNLMSKMTPKR